MISKRILTMQDLSCVGQCSLTIALPILSAYGIETCVLPTALLSNHTAYDRWSCLDLAPEMDRILQVWQKNEFRFDAFLLGYLGNTSLMKTAQVCFKNFSADHAPVIIDPVFGDNGKLYPVFDMNYVEAMARLIESANIILPNLTEACFLTKTQYPEKITRKFIKEVLQKLEKLTSAVIILTGIEEKGKIGEWIYTQGDFTEVWAPKLPGHFHGTGDLFSAVFTAMYLKTGDLVTSCEAAGEFVGDSIKETDGSHIYGVNFEAVLNKRLNPQVEERP